MALLISQFQKEVDGLPGLMRFSEVVSLFHEFSHVVGLSNIISSLIYALILSGSVVR